MPPERDKTSPQRSLFARFRAALAVSITLCALFACTLWLIGRITTDRFFITQYLAWIPTLAAAAVCLAAALLARVVDRRRTPLRLVLTLACITTVTWLLVAEHRAHAAFTQSTDPDAESFRIVHWNLSSNYAGTTTLLTAAPDPDLLILTNARNLMGEQDTTTRPHTLRLGIHRIYSRFPILEADLTDLGLRGVRWKSDPEKEGELAYDSGEAGYLVLDIGERGTLCIWLIDLPSDIRLARQTVTKAARERIDSFERSSATGFPQPDIILGDFNIPRGCDSIRTITRDLREASRNAGPLTVAASWPRHFPLWHIDQCYLTSRFKPLSYRLPDPGAGTHRALVVDITEAD